MKPDWKAADRHLIGEAWIGSRVAEHARVLCEQIGPRWSSTEAEATAIEYIREQMGRDGLDRADVETFELHTWSCERAAAVSGDGRAIDLTPFNRCPPCALNAALVDVGFGTPREVEAVRNDLDGAIAIMNMGHEPFTTPIPHNDRLVEIAAAGAAAAICVDTKTGRRAEYHNAGEWRFPETAEPPLPLGTTSREHGALLRRLAAAGVKLQLIVESSLYDARSANVVGQLDGSLWPEEQLVIGAHHDTVMGAPGGNDNSSGTIAVMETARVMAGLKRDLGTAPGRSIRFVTFAAEEQAFQGSLAYVERHCGRERPPRLMLNLDELSTGYIKGVVLAFDYLRDLIQSQFDDMGDGLKCHVMAQLDASSDHFPFVRRAIDAGHLWRWRFVGRNADADYHHEAADTVDKLNVRELKEYAGQLARLLLRLSHVPPADWPENPLTEEQVARRLEEERGTVVRVF